MTRLPVSGIDVMTRPPTGAEDVLLCELSGPAPYIALALLDCLGVPSDGEERDWGTLPAVDLEAWLLTLRQTVFGDLVSTDIRCSGANCSARMEISFQLSDYIGYHTPGSSSDLAFDDASGYYRLEHDDIAFRVPTVLDQISALKSHRPVRELFARCATRSRAANRRRIERALSRVAPCLSREMNGTCPECGAVTAFYFDVMHFILNELKHQAAFVFEDVHRIASVYHWREERILALSSARRRRYAELIDWERGGY